MFPSVVFELSADGFPLVGRAAFALSELVEEAEDEDKEDEDDEDIVFCEAEDVFLSLTGVSEWSVALGTRRPGIARPNRTLGKIRSCVAAEGPNASSDVIFCTHKCVFRFHRKTSSKL